MKFSDIVRVKKAINALMKELQRVAPSGDEEVAVALVNALAALRLLEGS